MKFSIKNIIIATLCFGFMLGMIACTPYDSTGSNNGSTSSDNTSSPFATSDTSPNSDISSPETDTPDTPATDDPNNTTSSGTVNTEPEETPKVSLDGKKVLIVGNSYVYHGRVTMTIDKDTLSQKSRENDKGLFYHLCKQMGQEVQVTNWTFGGHALYSLFGYKCDIGGTCYGVEHEYYLVDRYFDYVILSPSGGKKSETALFSDFEYIIDFFKEANPNVKIVCLGNLGCYGYSSLKLDLPGIYNSYDELEDDLDVIIADWGGIVNGIMTNKLTIANSRYDYTKNSFIVKDGYHPNMLSGYIAAITAYCAITGESAEGLPYQFCNDSTLNSAFNLSNYVSKEYYNPQDSNMLNILKDSNEVLRIQKLVDWYLQTKAYRSN